MKQALEELRAVKDLVALEIFRVKYLGTKGQFKDLMKLLALFRKNKSQRSAPKVNSAKEEVTAAFDQKKEELSATALVPKMQSMSPNPEKFPRSAIGTFS